VGVILALAVSIAAAADDDALIFGVLTPKCFNTFFVEFNLLDVECIKASISKALSYAIIGGAFVLKMPQILNIVKNQDTRGLASISLYMDVAAFLPAPTYNILNGNDFSTYGEAIVVLVENVIVVMVFWYYSPTQPKEGAEQRPSFTTMVGIAVSGVVLTASLMFMPESLWWTQPSIGVVFTIVSRLPQIYTNFSNGHTGQLAVVTWLLNFVGALARVLTCLTEKGISEASRPWLVGSFGIGASLSATILLQIGMYWGTTKKVLATQQSEKKTK